MVIWTGLFQGTCVVRRMYPPRLYKQGETKSLKKREYVYIVEERTDCQPYGEMDIILTQDIEGKWRFIVDIMLRKKDGSSNFVKVYFVKITSFFIFNIFCYVCEVVIY